MLGRLAGLLLTLSLAGCLHSKTEQLEAGKPCPTRQAQVALRGRVQLPESRDKSAAALAASSLQLSVYESYTIVQCNGDVMGVSSPGARLLVAELAREGEISLELTRTVLRDDAAPDLSVEVLMDQNGNGACDEGELAAQAEVQQDGTIGELLFDAPCGGRA